MDSPPNLTLLERCITQYGIALELARHLSGVDLYNLSRTSKTSWIAIAGCQLLFTKTMCHGHGVMWRTINQKLDQDQPQPKCASKGKYNEKGFDMLVDGQIQIRPCDRCHFQVCDECRFHCSYLHVSSPRSGWTPYDACVALSTTFYRVYTLLPKYQLGHDEGYMDTPTSTMDDARPIHRIINLDLGGTYLRRSELSTKVTTPLYEIAEQRKRAVCSKCFENGTSVSTTRHETDDTKGRHRCNCTLKSHLLDRWLCLHCYQLERKPDIEYHSNLVRHILRPWTSVGQVRFFEDDNECACGKSSKDEGACRILCSWCDGEVQVPFCDGRSYRALSQFSQHTIA